MKIREFQRTLITLIIQQKLLVIVFSIIVIMVFGVVGMSLLGSSGEQKLSVNDNTLNQGVTQNSQQAPQQSVQVPINQPAPTNTPLTTRFIYFIGSVLGRRPSPTPSRGQYSGTGRQGVTNQVSTQQIPVNNPVSESGNSGNGGGSSQGSQGGNQQSSGSSSPTSTPPPTDIEIVFVNENGEQWTYVPPEIPPVNVTWVKYINYQDHYSIEYPADWQVVTSNYNGHEGITLYMPGDPGNIDKPSIAFVGWNANYLTSTAKYTGQIILNGTPGTIYTNGPFGPSSIAAVFQYANGYFALGSSTSNEIFIYVFDHMLRSLEFNI